MGGVNCGHAIARVHSHSRSVMAPVMEISVLQKSSPRAPTARAAMGKRASRGRAAARPTAPAARCRSTLSACRPQRPPRCWAGGASPLQRRPAAAIGAAGNASLLALLLEAAMHVVVLRRPRPTSAPTASARVALSDKTIGGAQHGYVEQCTRIPDDATPAHLNPPRSRDPTQGFPAEPATAADELRVRHERQQAPSPSRCTLGRASPRRAGPPGGQRKTATPRSARALL